MKGLPYHDDWKFAFEAEFGLRVHWFGRYAGFPEWRVSRSRLAGDMLNFFFVESGHCWGLVNGVRIELHAGNLVVLRGADEFEFGHDPSNPHMNQLLYRDFQRRYSLEKPQEFVAEFEEVLSAFAGKGAFRDLAIAGAIMRWLAFLLETLRPPIVRSGFESRHQVDRVLAAESWAMSHLSEPITLLAWARAADLTPGYFGRVFKRETGKRPMDWLNGRRLEVASQLLVHTSQSVADIAEACGLSSPFYLSRIFKKHFGVGPRSFRRTGLVPEIES
jgi:AraC-like DNA-binding protein